MVRLKIREWEVKLCIILRLLYIHHFAVPSKAKYLITIEVLRNLVEYGKFCQEKLRTCRILNHGQHYSHHQHSTMQYLYMHLHWSHHWIPLLINYKKQFAKLRIPQYTPFAINPSVAESWCLPIDTACPFLEHFTCTTHLACLTIEWWWWWWWWWIDLLPSHISTCMCLYPPTAYA